MPLVIEVLQRHADLSGVSGNGKVAVVVTLPTGRCVVEWLKPPYGLNVYSSRDEVLLIHGHQGASTLEPIMQVPLDPLMGAR